MAGKFERSVKAWADKVSKRDLPKLAVASAMEAYSRVKERTPVDTGFAQASWWMSLGETGSPGQVVYAASLGDVIRVANSARYIVPLEYGHSKKRPEGMVRVTLAEWDSIVDEQARRLTAT